MMDPLRDWSPAIFVKIREFASTLAGREVSSGDVAEFARVPRDPILAVYPHRSIVPQNEVLCHFIQSELRIAEMVALRTNGPSGLRKLADDARYANAVALIDAIDADQEFSACPRRQIPTTDHRSK